MIITQVFVIVAVAIDGNTEYEKNLPMTRVHTLYCVIFDDVKVDIGHRAWGEKDMDGLKRGTK